MTGVRVAALFYILSTKFYVKNHECIFVPTSRSVTYSLHEDILYSSHCWRVVRSHDVSSCLHARESEDYMNMFLMRFFGAESFLLHTTKIINFQKPILVQLEVLIYVIYLFAVFYNLFISKANIQS